MRATAQEYLIPASMTIRDVKDALRTRKRLLIEPQRSVLRGFFDTFDWRLHRAGAVVEERWDGDQRLLVWHDARGREPSREQEISAEPGLAGDLPAGPVRERVAPVVGVRRLLPVLAVESRVQGVRLLDENEKTVARLWIEESTISDRARQSPRPLAVRLRLVPLKGYAADWRRIALMLEAELRLVPAETPLLVEALALVGKTPGDYSTKIDLSLDPAARADESTKVILLALLDTLEANLGGAKANLDAEFLHDLRVATRRTRSALGQIRGVFPEALVAKYRDGFAWLQQVTSRVRDLDVYLLRFPEYQAAIPEDLRPELEPLRGYLLAHYDETQAALALELSSARLRDLLVGWRSFLTTPVPGDAILANAARPTKAVADEQIWRLVRRTRREGHAITESAPPQALHELRKTLKKLRYLMEFFRSLYAAHEIGPPIETVKDLLDHLGDHQDLAVQAEQLRAIALRMHATGRAGSDTYLAMGALVTHLMARQQGLREGFPEAFRRFDDHPRRTCLRALFGPAQPEALAA